MITIYIYSLLSVLIVSLISFVSVFSLSLSEQFLKKYIFIFISLAVGALLGDAFLHLIPESFESFSNPGLAGVLIIAGITGFFAVEKYLHWHHHGEDAEEPHIHPVGKLVLFSDGIHNIADGMIIGASFIASIPLGIATTMAVILHEIPQELGDFTVLLHSGYTKYKAIWFNFLSALSAFFGVLISFALGQAGEGFVSWILSLAAGGFIYIAVADLIPELHKTKELKHSFLQAAGIIIGILAMLALLFIR